MLGDARWLIPHQLDKILISMYFRYASVVDSTPTSGNKDPCLVELSELEVYILQRFYICWASLRSQTFANSGFGCNPSSYKFKLYNILVLDLCLVLEYRSRLQFGEQVCSLSFISLERVFKVDITSNNCVS